jgi:dipeptidyl aminopeptidase/acylaminoacyl peptidase
VWRATVVTLAAAIALGATAAPALGANDGSIAYTVIRRVATTIYRVSPAGGPAQKITTGSSPSWSPDGRFLAFVRGSSVYTSRANGRGVQRILRNADHPAFSVSGDQIAFVRDRSLWVSKVDGSGAVRLFQAARQWSVATPTWSPGDSLIAFNYVKAVQAPDPTFAQLRAIALPGSGERGGVLNQPGQNVDGWINGGVSLAWQPQGDRLLLTLLLGPTGNGIGVGAITSSGSGTGASITGQAYASWAPDGRRFCLTGTGGLTRASLRSTVQATLVRDPPGRAMIGDCAWGPSP